MWPFKKKLVTDEFVTWRADKLNNPNPCKEKLLDEGECPHTLENAERLRRVLRGIYQSFTDSPPKPEHIEEAPITAQTYRTVDNCGVTIEIGRMGYAAMLRNGINFEIPRFSTAIPIVHLQYQDTFEEIFAEAVKNNQYIELSDEPQKLKYGFTVFRGDGIVRYTIRMADYNAPNKEELKMMGFETAVEDCINKVIGRDIKDETIKKEVK